MKESRTEAISITCTDTDILQYRVGLSNGNSPQTGKVTAVVSRKKDWTFEIEVSAISDPTLDEPTVLLLSVK